MRPVAKIVVGVLAVLGLAALVCAFLLVLPGLSAKREPPAYEVRMARSARHLLVPARARRLLNPTALNDELLRDARAHFADHCATCHGNDGRGDTMYGRNLYPRAPDLTAAATQTLSDGELFYFIEQGIKFTGMPAFGNGRPEGERASWELVRFIRHLPQITAAELEEMRRLNPMSRADLEAELAAEAFLRGEEPPTASEPGPTHEH
jgi:mono/diheme cytochrome c family protein